MAAIISMRLWVVSGSPPDSSSSRVPWRRTTPQPPEIGRAHVCTPVTNAQHLCRLLLEKKKVYDRAQITTSPSDIHDTRNNITLEAANTLKPKPYPRPAITSTDKNHSSPFPM